MNLTHNEIFKYLILATAVVYGIVWLIYAFYLFKSIFILLFGSNSQIQIQILSDGFRDRIREHVRRNGDNSKLEMLQKLLSKIGIAILVIGFIGIITSLIVE